MCVGVIALVLAKHEMERDDVERNHVVGVCRLERSNAVHDEQAIMELEDLVGAKSLMLRPKPARSSLAYLTYVQLNLSGKWLVNSRVK